MIINLILISTLAADVARIADTQELALRQEQSRRWIQRLPPAVPGKHVPATRDGVKENICSGELTREIMGPYCD